MAVNDQAAVDLKPIQSSSILGFQLQRLTSFRLMRNDKASQKRKSLSD